VPFRRGLHENRFLCDVVGHYVHGGLLGCYSAAGTCNGRLQLCRRRGQRHEVTLQVGHHTLRELFIGAEEVIVIAIAGVLTLGVGLIVRLVARLMAIDRAQVQAVDPE